MCDICKIDNCGTERTTRQLAVYLELIAQMDREGNYNSRNIYICAALGYAALLGMNVGIRVDSQEPEWPVVFIELPTGQVSWHIPQHTNIWDGHTTEEKYKRIADFCPRMGKQ